MLNKHTTKRMWIKLAVIALFALLPLIFAVSQTAATMQTAENGIADFDPANFSNPTKITNPFLPLKPRTQFTYVGFTVDDAGDQIPHEVVTTVTDLTKEICDGLEALVVYEEDLSDEELEEGEFYLVGQDNDGNVWRFGEYTEAYDPETGEFLGGERLLLCPLGGAWGGVGV